MKILIVCILRYHILRYILLSLYTQCILYTKILQWPLLHHITIIANNFYQLCHGHCYQCSDVEKNKYSMIFLNEQFLDYSKPIIYDLCILVFSMKFSAAISCLKAVSQLTIYSCFFFQHFVKILQRWCQNTFYVFYKSYFTVFLFHFSNSEFHIFLDCPLRSLELPREDTLDIPQCDQYSERYD